jgi:hypothetical protein
VVHVNAEHTSQGLAMTGNFKASILAVAVLRSVVAVFSIAVKGFLIPNMDPNAAAS